MAVEYVECCDSYVDLDYRVDEVIYYEGTAYCFEHLKEHLMDKMRVSEQDAEAFIDKVLI